MRAVIFLLLVACQPPGYGMGDDEPQPIDATAAIDSSTDGSAALVCDKAFRLDAHATANTVWLSGSFVQWAGDPAHGAIAFVLGLDGGWTGTYSFAAGAHQYKFVINGSEWIADPTNPDQVDDGVGGKNSLFTCSP